MAFRVFPVMAGMIAVALAAGAAPLEGQIRASERGQVAQTVDGTTIKLDYARPRARGRDSVFGGEVKWGEVWTPGANYATTLELDRDVQINGHAVPKGKYSVWMTVRADSDWTVMFDTTAKLYHTERPAEHPWQILFTAHPEHRAPIEVLTWWFPEVRPDGAIMAMQWGDRYVPLNVTVTPSHPITVAADLARQYVGKYDFAWVEADSAKGNSDSTGHSTTADSGAAKAPPPTTFTVVYERGSLWGMWDPAPWPGMEKVLLIRAGDDLFFPTVMKDGQIYDSMDDMAVEFQVANGRASGFEVRIDTDEMIAKATRKP
jgi:hypothetical protein